MDAAVGNLEASVLLDDAALAGTRAAGLRRLYTVQIPALRAAGFAILCVIVWVQHAGQAVPLGLLGANALYALLAWPALRWAHRAGRAHAASLFLFHADVVMWLCNLYVLERTNLFFAFFLLVRVVDQVGVGFRRAAYFALVVTAAYASYAVWIGWFDAPRALADERAAIVLVMGLIGLYLALTGLVTERLAQPCTRGGAHHTGAGRIAGAEGIARCSSRRRSWRWRAARPSRPARPSRDSWP